jgi:hypothetical protein
MTECSICGAESEYSWRCSECGKLLEGDDGDDRDARTDGGGEIAVDRIDQLQYLTKGELREEIVYAVGGDPTRYGSGSDRGLKKADVKRIATHLQPEDSDILLNAMDLGNLYEVACRWAGGEYQPNTGNPWGVNRSNLKQIHRAVGGVSPRENLVAATDGGNDRDYDTGGDQS